MRTQTAILLAALLLSGCITPEQETTSSTVKEITPSSTIGTTTPISSTDTTTYETTTTTSSTTTMTKSAADNLQYFHVILDEPKGISVDENLSADDRIRNYISRKDYWNFTMYKIIEDMVKRGITPTTHVEPNSDPNRYYKTRDGRIIFVKGNASSFSSFLDHPQLKLISSDKILQELPAVFSKDELGQCNYDDDCVRVYNSFCGQNSVSINTKFREFWEDWLDYQRIDRACLAYVSDDVSLASYPVCQNQTCGLIPDRKQICTNKGYEIQCSNETSQPYDRDFSLRNQCNFLHYICSTNNTLHTIPLDWGFYSNHKPLVERYSAYTDEKLFQYLDENPGYLVTPVILERDFSGINYSTDQTDDRKIQTYLRRKSVFKQTQADLIEEAKTVGLQVNRISSDGTYLQGNADKKVILSLAKNEKVEAIYDPGTIYREIQKPALNLSTTFLKKCNSDEDCMKLIIDRCGALSGIHAINKKYAEYFSDMGDRASFYLACAAVARIDDYDSNPKCIKNVCTLTKLKEVNSNLG
jgi:hypothetical protein